MTHNSTKSSPGQIENMRIRIKIRRRKMMASGTLYRRIMKGRGTLSPRKMMGSETFCNDYPPP